MYGAIRVDLTVTRDKGYLTGFHGAGKSSVVKILPRVFLEKQKNPPSNCRSSKYVFFKEIWTGPVESHDVGKAEMHNFITCK